MTAGTCVYGDGWADPAVIVEDYPGTAGPGWVKYAHPQCAEEHGCRDGDDEDRVRHLRTVFPPVATYTDEDTETVLRRIADRLPRQAESDAQGGAS